MKTTTQNTAWRSQDKTNTPRPAGNGERRGSDVSDRLLAFTSTLLGLAGSLPEDRAGGHLAEQLLRSGTAAYFRHGEAEGSPSAKEFADKFRAALTELRISRRALQLQLLTRRHEAPPAQTWAQDVAQVLAGPFDAAAARRLQAVLKVLLKR